MAEPLRVAFVTGTTPDKWARAWRDQRRGSLELVPVTEVQARRRREAELRKSARLELSKQFAVAST